MTVSQKTVVLSVRRRDRSTASLARNPVLADGDVRKRAFDDPAVMIFLPVVLGHRAVARLAIHSPRRLTRDDYDQHMPELRSRFGYPVVLGVMGVVAGSVLLYFRRRGWLGKPPPLPPITPPAPAPRRSRAHLVSPSAFDADKRATDGP